MKGLDPRVAGALAKSYLEDGWVGDLSDSLKSDLSTCAGAVSQSVRQASGALNAEFEDAGAEYVDRVKQAGRDAMEAARESRIVRTLCLRRLCITGRRNAVRYPSKDVHAGPVFDRADLAPRRSISRYGAAIESKASAGQRSTYCAPPIQCIGKVEARSPYEFGCKISSVTPLPRPGAGRSCSTLRRCTAIRMIATRYRAHGYPDRCKVWISGQVHRVTKVIRREIGRRAAVGSQGRPPDAPQSCRGRDGDRINAMLVPAGITSAGTCDGS